ncbi:unnamed protein product [Parnassius mnemosyne]|uniref:Uncharacterized protein n=1 Tax=Parnassius mnemosyne TaxID=213953 RepID=A0AAV1LFA9_9NEOP
MSMLINLNKNPLPRVVNCRTRRQKRSPTTFTSNSRSRAGFACGKHVSRCARDQNLLFILCQKQVWLATACSQLIAPSTPTLTLCACTHSTTSKARPIS